MGLRKMMGRKMCKEMYREIRLEVDGKIVELPPVEGIIILNILRYLIWTVVIYQWVIFLTISWLYNLCYYFNGLVGDQERIHGVSNAMTNFQRQIIGMVCWKLLESRGSFIWVKFNRDYVLLSGQLRYVYYLSYITVVRGTSFSCLNQQPFLFINYKREGIFGFG